MYGVFDDDKPASAEGYPNLKGCYGWDNHIFNTFDAAQEYAQNYLGQFWCGLFELNKPKTYTAGHVLEIRKIS